MRRLTLALLLWLGLATPSTGLDVPAQYVDDMVLRTDDLLRCEQPLRDAIVEWPKRYGGITRQGLSVAHDADALRREAELLHRRFRDAANPFRVMLSSVADDGELESRDEIQRLYATLAGRLASVCWDLELRGAVLEIDRLSQFFRDSKLYKIFDERVAEIKKEWGHDEHLYQYHYDKLVAEIEEVEQIIVLHVAQEFSQLGEQVSNRRMMLSGSLKALTANLQELLSLRAAAQLRAANYRLFAEHLDELPDEEVVRIFGSDQNRALLVSALDAFSNGPGRQDVLVLWYPTRSLYGYIEMAIAPDFGSIPVFNHRLIGPKPILVIEAGRLSIVAEEAPK